MKVLLLTGGETRHTAFSRDVQHDTRIVCGEISKQVQKWVLDARPDVILVYGTGKLPPPVVRAAPVVLNFHGGDPENYRGLDSHLWALHHNDPLGLQATLHYVDDGLDTGDIVFQTQLDLTDVRSLAGLQQRTMETCVKLAHLALHGLRTGFLPRRQQATRGRYYSRIPEKHLPECTRRLLELAS